MSKKNIYTTYTYKHHNLSFHTSLHWTVSMNFFQIVLLDVSLFCMPVFLYELASRLYIIVHLLERTVMLVRWCCCYCFILASNSNSLFNLIAMLSYNYPFYWHFYILFSLVSLGYENQNIFSSFGNSSNNRK